MNNCRDSLGRPQADAWNESWVSSCSSLQIVLLVGRTGQEACFGFGLGLLMENLAQVQWKDEFQHAASRGSKKMTQLFTLLYCKSLCLAQNCLHGERGNLVSGLVLVDAELQK